MAAASFYVLMKVSTRLSITAMSVHIKLRMVKKAVGVIALVKSGQDTVLRVPVGTIIYDDDTDELIADLSHPSSNRMRCARWPARHWQCGI